MTLRSLMTMIIIFNWNFSNAQEIENLSKKELRFELSANQLEIDSLNKIILYLRSQITNNLRSYDSLSSVYFETRRVFELEENEKKYI